MAIDRRITKLDELSKLAQAYMKEKDPGYGMLRSLRNLSKEIIIRKNHENGLKKRPGNLSSKDKLQIGGGKHILPGFFNIDIFPPADLVYDVREGIPLKDESMKIVFSEHFLEHIDYPISVKKFINESYRVLRKNGQIIIGVPDAKLPIAGYVKKDVKLYQKLLKEFYSKRSCLEHFNTYIDMVNYVFRDQDDDEKYTPHLWAYDFEKLSSMLKIAGFKNVKKWKFDPTLANPKRKFGSIYVVALK